MWGKRPDRHKIGACEDLMTIETTYKIFRFAVIFILFLSTNKYFCLDFYRFSIDLLDSDGANAPGKKTPKLSRECSKCTVSRTFWRIIIEGGY